MRPSGHHFRTGPSTMPEPRAGANGKRWGPCCHRRTKYHAPMAGRLFCFLCVCQLESPVAVAQISSAAYLSLRSPVSADHTSSRECGALETARLTRHVAARPARLSASGRHCARIVIFPCAYLVSLDTRYQDRINASSHSPPPWLCQSSAHFAIVVAQSVLRQDDGWIGSIGYFSSA